MSDTLLANTAVHAKQYEQRVLKSKLDNTLFNQWIAHPTEADADFVKLSLQEAGSYTTPGGTPIMQTTLLQGNQGDAVQFPTLRPLSGAGFSQRAGQSPEGSEEQLDAAAFSVSLDVRSNAVEVKSTLSAQAVQFLVKKQCSDLALAWLADDKEKQMATALQTAPTNNMFAGGSANLAGIGTSDTLTMEELSKAALLANRNTIGGLPRLEPYKYKGRDYLFAIASPEALYDLKQDPEWKKAVNEHYDRQTFFADSPVFNNARMITVDGIVVFEYSRAASFTDVAGQGANVPGTQVTIFGNNCLAVAEVGNYTLTEGQNKYPNKFSFYVDHMFGVGKTQFDGEDYGSLNLFCATSLAAVNAGTTPVLG